MSAERKKQQYMVIALAGSAIVGAIGVIAWALAPANGSTSVLPEISGSVDTTLIADRTSSAAPEMSWVARSREELSDLRELVENQMKTIDGLRAEQAKELRDVRLEYDEQLLQQAEKIALLEQTKAAGPARGSDLEIASLLPGDGGLTNPGIATPDYSGIGSEFVTRNPVRGRYVAGEARPGVDYRPDAAIKDSFGTTFDLAALPTVEVDPGRVTLSDYVPAGSYASAVVLSGADAATNVSDRENPTPVLLRVTGPAITAAAGSRKGRVDIVGCTVQGSAIGDLSSERVKVRLLSMTCLDRTGAVLETRIKGYVTGSGKAGVRGRVVGREGKVIGNAAIAGVLEGLAGAAGGNAGASDGDVTAVAGNALSAIGASGTQNAASTLSEYYINRAEQYQPVVSLYAGTKVEIVFLEGVKVR